MEVTWPIPCARVAAKVRAVPTTTVDDAGDLARLLAAARGGDGGAFDSIYARFVRVVHGIALSTVGPVDADDVVQDVFVKVFRSLPELRDPQALPGWVCAIARSRSVDRLRRRRREPAQPMGDADADVTGRCAASGGGDVGASEFGARVFACIATLPPAYRETLVLRLVEGLSGPEIAERTGMTHGSVRVNLTRGMALLRPLLQKEGWP